METLLEPVILERPYFYCAACHHGFHPLDQALGLSAHHKQWDVQQAGVELALEMPHERASKLLDELTDASMSDCAIHEVLQVCPDAAEIQERIAQAAAGRKARPISWCWPSTRPTCRLARRPPRASGRTARKAGLAESAGRASIARPRASVSTSSTTSASCT